jgi:hypothetical protein
LFPGLPINKSLQEAKIDFKKIHRTSPKNPAVIFVTAGLNNQTAGHPGGSE